MATAPLSTAAVVTNDSERQAEVAAQLISFNARLGLRKRLEGVRYMRIIEYTRTWMRLSLTTDSALLDLGAGTHSILGLFANHTTGACCHITDLDKRVPVHLHRARRVPALRSAVETGRIVAERQDATRLTYPDENFDAVTAISSIEHIPDGGDSLAMREAWRVLKPGGVLVVTVPMMSGAPALDVYRRRKNYTHAFQGEPLFFAHRYDPDTLRARLIEAALFSRCEVEYWHDDDFYTHRWGKVRGRHWLQYLVGWWLTRVCLREFHQLDEADAAKASLGILTFTK